MRPEIKFCGLVRAEDASEAARLHASYVGAIFAGGPRMIDATRARENFRALPAAVRRVGVFGAQSAERIAATVEEAGLDVVQMHADPTVEDVDAVRLRCGGRIWAVVRVTGRILPPNLAELADRADAVVLDAKAEGALGGTGRTLDWEGIAAELEPLRARTRLVLAGGLTPDNVARAIELLRPHVVDVSSGVEREPGVKDHARMRAFTEAVRQGE